VDKQEEKPEKFVGKKAFLFCGIANPEQYFRLASSCGVVVVGKKAFPDHHWFRTEDFLDLQMQYSTSSAGLLLTTMKDAARLSGSSEGRAFVRELPVYGENAFHQQLDRLIA
jgi:tetraacyldisaccharide-1-P 4'-kinase